MEKPLIQRDEIYLASFPFGDTPGMKLRPVLTLTATVGSIPEVLVAYYILCCSKFAAAVRYIA